MGLFCFVFSLAGMNLTASVQPKAGVRCMPVATIQLHRSSDENRLYRRCRRSPCRFLLPERRSRPKQAGLRGAFKIMTFARVFTRVGRASMASGFPKISTKPTAFDPMIRILSSIVASVFALMAASCCCTSEVKPPGLRPLPQFQEIQAAPAPEVHPTK
jgi:hypothetical protein